MKKCIFLLLLVGILGGCTNSEQEEQIRSFWSEQFARVLPQPKLPDPESLPVPPPEAIVPDGRETTPNASAKNPVEVVLFMHPQSPEYVQLKQDKFVEKFQQSYAGRIDFKEYDVSSATGNTMMRRFMHAHNLSRLVVPALVVGNTVLQYPFEGIGQVMQNAFAAEPVSVFASPKQVKPRTTNPSYQFMEIKIEEDLPKDTKVNRHAPVKDRLYIQRALESAQSANQTTLRDIGRIFGPETQAQAFVIVAQSEKVLRTTAQTSESAQKYLATQNKVLRQQEQMLNRLMRNNARNLRAVRG